MEMKWYWLDLEQGLYYLFHKVVPCLDSLEVGNFHTINLLPFNSDPSITTKLIFGSDSEVVVSKSLVSKQDLTPYFVKLERISVGQNFVEVKNRGEATALLLV